MPRFLLFVFLVFSLIVGGLWIFVIAYPMAYFNFDYPNWKAKAERLDQCRVGTVAFVGDSAALAGIDPDQIGFGSMNFALGGGKMADMLIISKRILACAKPPKAVILVVTLKGFEYDTACCFWEHSVRWGLLHISFDELEDLRRLSRRYDDTMVFGGRSLFDSDARLKNILSVIKFPSYYAGTLLEAAREGDRLSTNQEIYVREIGKKGMQKLNQAHGKWDPNFFDYKMFPEPQPFQQALLDKIMELYQERNVPLYYMAPPYKAEDVKNFTPALRSGFEGFLADYEKRYPNFHVVGDVFPAYPNLVFGDMSHVNLEGVAVYSKDVVHILKENRIGY